MKNAILMVSIGDSRKQYTHYSLPLIEFYAKKHNLNIDFITKATKFPENFDIRFYKLVCIHESLKKYDRILYLDDTCLINPMCENLLDIVDYSCVGSMIESKYFNRTEEINYMMKSFNHVLPKDNKWIMINSGVVVASRLHSCLFDIKKHYKYIESNQEKLAFKDQSLLSCIVSTTENVNVQDLTEKYNFVGSKALAAYANNCLKKICEENMIIHVTRGAVQARNKIMKYVSDYYRKMSDSQH